MLRSHAVLIAALQREEVQGGKEGKRRGEVTLFTLFAYSHSVVSVVTSNLPVGDSLGEDQCSTRDSLGLVALGSGMFAFSFGLSKAPCPGN